jgi:hypothetical protein
MMGDVTDLEAYRKQLRESVSIDDDDAIMKCPKCSDMYSMTLLVSDFTVIDEQGPYALVCQHCGEPWGSVYLFDEESEES